MDCQHLLKDEKCQRLYDSIYSGNNTLAKDLIDEFVDDNYDFNLCDCVPHHVVLGMNGGDDTCPLLLYACMNGRNVIVNYLLETSMFNDYIIEIINILLNNDNYTYICDYYIKENDSESKYYKTSYEYFKEKAIEQNIKIGTPESTDLLRQVQRRRRDFNKNTYFIKFKKILKLLLSYLTKKQIQYIDIPPLILLDIDVELENSLGDDYLSQIENGEITMEDIDNITKKIEKDHSTKTIEYNEIVDIIQKHQGTIYHKDIPSQLRYASMKSPTPSTGGKRTKKNKKYKRIKHKKQKITLKH
jgi:hypothetical protein